MVDIVKFIVYTTFYPKENVNFMKDLSNLTDEQKLIYFAGLMDGEGCFTLSRHGGGKRPIVQLQMTDKNIIELFAKYFNLVVRELNSPSRQNPKWKQLYQARAECQKAYPIIKALYPYLSTKYEEAKICLDYYDDRKCEWCGSPIPPERNKKSKFCSKKCQIASNNKKRRESTKPSS